ncbi:MAG: replication-associated recombination protein A [Clostridia bacterium]|nr:replication-associated recombination protein A [Clostridia bacterium]
MEITTPLAERMRPVSLEEFVGQKHIVGQNMLLNRAITMGQLGSCIFYGPPGTGKTTLANIISNTLNGIFRKLNAVSSGVSDAKAVIEEAKKNKMLYGKQTYLLLDECHRWSKSQSDCVLSAIEDGSIIFIGSTTENPFTSMTRAIVSRCRVFEFKHLSDQDIIGAMNRALKEEKGLGSLPIEITEGALKHLAWASGGDLRMALNSLELAAKTTPLNKNKKVVIDETVAEQSIQKKVLSIGETEYYDLLSCFCKSIRGSDADAALYYSQRLISAGCDPLIIARRLIAHTSEDIGMADSNALLLATCAMYAIQNMGIPEGLIPLSHAIIYACEAEKSNSVIVAMNAAKEDAENIRDDVVPNHLKNHPTINGPKTKYKYPHDYGGYVKQQYLPDKLKDKIYYVPSENGREKNLIRKKFKK